MKCEFYDEKRNRCEVRDVIRIYGKSTFNVRRLRKGYKKTYCATDKHKFCGRRHKLHSIIKDGDYDDG